MAEELGRNFERRALWTLVAQADPNDRAGREAGGPAEGGGSRPPGAPLDRRRNLYRRSRPPWLSAKRVSRGGPPRPSRRPAFLDDAEAAGLRFSVR